MAAAVMRAMTFGLSDGGASSSRNDDGERRSRPTSRQAGGGGSNSRSSSKTGGALARSLSRGFGGGGGGDHADGSEEGDTIGESLSRTSSRMAPPASILLNPNRPSPLPSPSNSPPNASHLNIPTTSTSLSALSGADLSRSISSPADLAVSPPSSSTAAGGLSASRPTGQLQRQSSDLSTTSSTTSRTSFQQPPITPIHGFFPSAAYSSYQNTPSSSASPSASKQQQQQKRESTIRFAPLPEIRPRSYSTGHNVWLEDDPEFDPDSGEPLEGYFEGVGDPVEGGGGEGGQGLPRRRFVRRDDVEAGDYALDDEDDHRPSSSSKWGSWTEAFLPTSARRVDDDAVSTTSSNGPSGTSFSGLERTTSGTSSLGGASNYSAGTTGSNGGNGGGGGSSKKLLKAFGFGKSKKSKKGTGTGMNGDDGDLSRTSSVDSSVTHSTSAAGDAAALDRRSSIDGPTPLSSPSSLLRPASTQTPLPRPKGSTGIPMRKASTWEAGDSPSASRNSTTGAPVYYASPARSARKRANYPPVAQRSRNAARSARSAVQVEEPAFSEWGSVAGSGSGPVGRGSAGGGRHGAGGRMLAKEAAGGGGEEEDDGSGLAWLKKRRAERERREREEREQAAAAAVALGGEEGGVPSSSSDAPLAATSIGELPSSSSAPDSSSSSALSSLAARRSLRSPPTRSGTLDSTTSVSSNATVRPSTPHAPPPAPSGLAASRPTLSVDIAAQPVVQVRGESSSPEAEGEEEGGEGEDTPATTPMSAVSASTANDDEEEEESESEDEEEEGEQDEEDDDDDLDAEELAREEALAEEAKRGAKAMGAERYHSASHENRLLQVSDA